MTVQLTSAPRNRRADVSRKPEQQMCQPLSRFGVRCTLLHVLRSESAALDLPLPDTGPLGAAAQLRVATPSQLLQKRCGVV